MATSTIVTKQPNTTLPGTAKVYRALMTQASTAVPTLIVLVNTLGQTPTTTRDSAGIYHLVFSTPLPKDKTTVNMPNNHYGSEGIAAFPHITSGAIEYIYITSYDTTGTPAYKDGLLINNYIEIIVYP